MNIDLFIKCFLDTCNYVLSYDLRPGSNYNGEASDKMERKFHRDGGEAEEYDFGDGSLAKAKQCLKMKGHGA